MSKPVAHYSASYRAGDLLFVSGQLGLADGSLVEGVEAQTPYRGPTISLIDQLTGGLRSAMGYIGAVNVAEMQAKSRFVRVTGAGMDENHVHDVVLVKEAPNYRQRSL